jgi:hypothetical protein
MNNTSNKKVNQKKYDMPPYGLCPIILLPHLNRIELVTYIVLQRYQGQSESCYPGMDIICQNAGLSRKSVSKAIFNLTKKGLLGVQRRYGKSSIYTVRYFVEDDIEQIQKEIKQKNKEIRAKEKNRKVLEKSNIEYEHRGNNHGNPSGDNDCEHRGDDECNPRGENYNINPLEEPIIYTQVCETQPIVNNNEVQENKAEPKKDLAHTHYEDPIIEELSKDSDFEKLIKSLDALNTNIGDEKRLATITREQEINTHYSNEIAKVEQELARQSDIILPKLSTGSLLEASEDFLRRIGIGFDHSPRRILNLIYKNLPSDFVIKEDSKDVEILGDMIKKYMASRQDERESIAKRIYQAVEAMLKIYVIKKYGEPYREVLYPEILRANLVLYLNCNPTFKYCLGGFSNDIDGVYTEVCRLAEKEAKKKVDAIKIEHAKKIRQLEANRQSEIRSMFSETEITEFQKRNDEILRRMDSKGDIEDMPLNKPIQANLTEEEKQELNLLFVKSDKTNDDVIRMNFLIRKSRKL